MSLICAVLEPFEVYYEIWQLSQLGIFVSVTEESLVICASGIGLPLCLGSWN
jgi:hypothetical protein